MHAGGPRNLYPSGRGGGAGEAAASQLYIIFCEQRGDIATIADSAAVAGAGGIAGDQEAASAAKKERLTQWKDMSELLCAGVRMLFERAGELGVGGA